MAKLFVQERQLKLNLTVVPLQNWSRDLTFDETGLKWINPSPNLRNLTQATLYPGIGFLEFLNLSVGRGTAKPFEHVGAPWLNGKALTAALRAENLPGIAFAPDTFTPESSVFAGEVCRWGEVCGDGSLCPPFSGRGPGHRAIPGGSPCGGSKDRGPARLPPLSSRHGGGDPARRFPGGNPGALGTGTQRVCGAKAGGLVVFETLTQMEDLSRPSTTVASCVGA